jgi:hypothetical protein
MHRFSATNYGFFENSGKCEFLPEHREFSPGDLKHAAWGRAWEDASQLIVYD